MNLLLYPEPVKFKRRTPLEPECFQYLEGCVREEVSYEIPTLNSDKPLLYVSFGSLGAGDTTLLVKGEVEGSLDGIALKGQLDIVGNHYEQFSNDLFGKGVGFPERLERFRGRANLFVNPAVMRLSEAVVRLEDVQLVGTLIRQRMEQKNVGQYHLFEGAFRLDNMNIDEWVDAQPAVEFETRARGLITVMKFGDPDNNPHLLNNQ